MNISKIILAFEPFLISICLSHLLTCKTLKKCPPFCNALYQPAKKFKVLFLFFLVSTLVVPGSVFALEEEIKDLDELVDVEKSPLKSKQMDSKVENDEKKYIVVFKEKPNKKDMDKIKSLGKVKNQFKIIPGVVAELKENQVEGLKKDKRILKIYEDVRVYAFLDDSVNIIDADTVHASTITGNGVKVCIVDTGIDDSHPALNPLLAEKDFVNEDADATDDNGHGTHVAGIVASQDSTFGGVSPGASLMAAKVLNQYASGAASVVVLGIEWCVYGPDGTPDTGDEADIISMSLGTLEGFPSTCDSEIMATAANAAVDAGLTVFAATGNNGYTDSINDPACGSKVIAVGAVDKFDSKASFSNEGSELDVVAPGVAITSSVPTGSCTHCEPSGWKELDGTSMATPHAAATAALLLEADPALSNWDIRAIMEETTVDLGSPGLDDIFGHGRIDANDSLLIATTGYVDPPNSIFFDGFEGSQSKWVESGTMNWSFMGPSETSVPGHLSSNEVMHADDCDEECTITMTTPVDLTAHTGAALSFWRFVDNDIDSGEYLKVEAYDGASWNTLFSWTDENGNDNTWHQETVDLTDYLGVSEFNLRFVSIQSLSTEDVEIDDVLIEEIIDGDMDGVADEDDNCPTTPNPGQGDFDADDMGDVCDILNLIITDTIVSSDFTSFGNMSVQNNSLLTINSGVTVAVPPGSNITIQSGSGVLIKDGGTLQVIA